MIARRKRGKYIHILLLLTHKTKTFLIFQQKLSKFSTSSFSLPKLSHYKSAPFKPAELSDFHSIYRDFFLKIWSPPESLRREVEEKVYEGLVNKRIQAGEDPYPVTYCRQVN